MPSPVFDVQFKRLATEAGGKDGFTVMNVGEFLLRHEHANIFKRYLELRRIPELCEVQDLSCCIKTVRWIKQSFLTAETDRAIRISEIIQYKRSCLGRF